MERRKIPHAQHAHLAFVLFGQESPRKYTLSISTPFSTCISTSARLAQSVEHETLNLRVVGSSPTLGEKHFFIYNIFFDYANHLDFRNLLNFRASINNNGLKLGGLQGKLFQFVLKSKPCSLFLSGCSCILRVNSLKLFNFRK